MSTPNRSRPALADMLGQRLAGRDAAGAAGRARAAADAGSASMRGVERRHAAEDRRLMRAQSLEHRAGVGRSGSSTAVAPTAIGKVMRVAEPVGEEELRRREHHVVRADAEHLRAIGSAVALRLRMHVSHALRRAGRARGIEPERDFVRRASCTGSSPGSPARDEVGEARSHAGRRRPAAAIAGSPTMIAAAGRGAPQHRPQRRQQRRRDAPAPRRGCRPGCSDCSGVSSVLTGTGTTPARSAPQNATGKSTVSSISSAMRRSRPIPAPRSAAGEARRRLGQLGIGQAASRVDEGRCSPRPAATWRSSSQATAFPFPRIGAVPHIGALASIGRGSGHSWPPSSGAG